MSSKGNWLTGSHGQPDGDSERATGGDNLWGVEGGEEGGRSDKRTSSVFPSGGNREKRIRGLIF